MSDWVKSEDCGECGGEGFYRRLNHQTEEYSEYEKEQCTECENLLASMSFKKISSCEECGGLGFMWNKLDLGKSWSHPDNKIRKQCEVCEELTKEIV